MAKTYYSVLTTYGSQAFAKAVSSKAPLNITHFAVGDGNGKAVQPDSKRTTLVREVHRATVSAISLDPRNNKQVIFELTIPENVGGFWLREMGIFDNSGRLVAYANCPETYKPTLAEGSGKVQVLRMILLVSSSNAITLTVDDTVIFATRGQLTPKSLTATTTNAVDDTGHTHALPLGSITQKGVVQMTNDTGLDSEVLALTAKAGKALSQRIAGLETTTPQKLNTKVDKTAISNAVNSTSTTTVASSQAVKTAYDKGVEALDAVNALQVGGRNLVRDSQFSSHIKWGSPTIEFATEGEHRTVKIRATGTTGPVGVTQLAKLATTEVKQGEKLTLSLYVRGNTPLDYDYLMRLDGNNSRLPVITPESETDFTHHKITFASPFTTTQGYILIGFIQQNAEQWVEFHSLKLERGHLATDWTPAPEDVDAQVAQVQANLTAYQEEMTEKEKVLKQEIGKKVDKTAISNAVDSTSTTTVASSQAVKTAYDKGVEALNKANLKLDAHGGTMTGHVSVNRRADQTPGELWGGMHFYTTGAAGSGLGIATYGVNDAHLGVYGIVDDSYKSRFDLYLATQGNNAFGGSQKALQVMADGGIWTKQYGWLHEKFGIQRSGIGGFKITKFPDGTMLQSYAFYIQDLVDFSERQFSWAEAFLDPPCIMGSVKTSVNGSHDAGINILTKSTNSVCYYYFYEHGGTNQGYCRVEFLAFGRWK